MSNCKHEFIGTSTGVHCSKCGLKMSPEEYAKFIYPESKVNAKAKTAGKKVKSNE